MGNPGGTAPEPRNMAGFIVASVAFTLLLGTAVALVLGSEQVFSAVGVSRRAVLPVLYLLMAVAVVGAARSGWRPTVAPLWIWAPLLLATTSFLLNLHSFLHTDSLSDAVQGMLLLGGFSVLGLAGVGSGAWDETQRWALIRVLGVFSLVAVLLPYPSLSLAPYIGLVPPMVFVAILLGLKGPDHRFLWLCLGVAVGALGMRVLHPAPGQPISIAVLGGIAVGVGMLVLTLLPRAVRTGVVALGAPAFVVVATTSSARSYLTGHYTGTDVTLSQRAFETRAIASAVADSPLGILVGRGPAATVDLSQSPDRIVLQSSGRDLFHVDDVHLLTAYMLFKLGVLGLVWVVWLLVVTYRMVWAEMSAPQVDLWRVCLLTIVLSGLVDAFPAGTELFSNPTTALFLGILWADSRWRVDRGPGRRDRRAVEISREGSPSADRVGSARPLTG